MLSERYIAKEQEPKWQKFWQEESIYAFEENDTKRKIYSIDTPPPSVSGSLHIGHIFSYTQTEIAARIKRMQGYNVFYSLGFDNNGMPTERLVEKLYGKKSKEYTREEFNNLCIKTMIEYQALYKDLYNRMGFSFDYRYSYSTISPQAQKLSQLEFLKNYKANLAYYADLPSTFCPDCQSAVAQTDLETKVCDTIFNYLNFEIENENAKLPVATTRPEMLCACVCVFVNPKDKRFAQYIGKNAIVPLYNKKVKILGDDKAEIDKGTGVVMCCTYGDQTDLYWQIKHNLPVISVINYNGTMNELAGKYAGLYVTKARRQIIEDLKTEGYIFKQETISHSVNVHERCGTAVEIIPKKQWSIKICEFSSDFVKNANKILWFPQQMKARHNNWALSVDRDWNISRQRYFGVSFPVWHCEDCGEIIVADESELPVNPLEVKKGCCPKCKSKNVTGDPDVMDTWATSSISPLLATANIKNEKLRESMHPMSMRPNAHDIIRTWDFYTIVRAFHKNKQIPWENVVVSGHVLASDGGKISKSKGGGKVEPNALIDAYSADVIRYWTASSTLGVDTPLSEEQLKNGAKLVNKLFNAARFVTAQLADFDKSKKVKLNSVDEGFLELFYEMQKGFNDYASKYEIGLALNLLEKYFWNFCDNYIEIAKNRLYKAELFGVQGRASAQHACYEILLSLLKMFAPYLPHICEEIYKGFFEQFENIKSIHLTVFADEKKSIDELKTKKVNAFCDAVKEVRKFKSEKKMSMKNELAYVKVCSEFESYFEENRKDFEFTLNIKKCEFANEKFFVEIKE